MVEVSGDLQVGVLGALLMEPKLVGPVMAQVRAEDFVSPVYRTIYQAITELFLEGKPVDLLLVNERLSGMGPVFETLFQIMEVTPTAANIWAYVPELKKQAALVSLREIGQQLEMAPDIENAQELVDRANAVFSARPGGERVSAQKLVEDFMDRHGEGKHPDYLTWSLPKLNDRMYTELGDMILLGGYPSAGKTALALRFAWHMAKTRRVGFYSLETGPSKLGDRSVSAIAGIDMGAIKRSALTDGDWEKLADHAENMAHCSLDLIPAGGMTVQDIQADALAHRYEVIYLDYVQLVRVVKAGNRTEAVTGTSIELHQLAQTHGITVVALSQLSRAKPTSGGEEAAPTMSSLRESGQLEQDADAILLLYPEKRNNPESRRVLFVAKNKEGGIGRIYLDFDGRTQTFRESDTTGKVASALSAAGRRAKQRIQEPEMLGPTQMSFEDVTDKWDRNFPFADKEEHHEDR